MKILAIEMSSARGSVAVADDGRITREEHFECGRGRGAGVFSAVAGTRDAWLGAELIAVGIGPGSYNGLRTACALAGSMQMATGARLCALPSPCLLEAGEKALVVYGDARGGRAYRAEVRDRKLRGEIALLDYAAAAEAAKRDATACRVGPLTCLDWLREAHPAASVLAQLAPVLPLTDPSELRPIYLKPPHITLPRAART